MSILADLVLCPTAQMRRLDCNRPPLKMRGGPCDGVQFKNLTSLQFALLWAGVEGAEWSFKTHPYQTVHERIEEGSAESGIEHFPHRMVTAFANANDALIAVVARQLADSPNFRGWQADDLVWLMNEVRQLSRRAGGRELCLWWSL